MKNIHLLPTEKSSRLGYLTKKGKEVFKDLRLFDKPMPNILDSENQHIYITSDEEIKEGDWCYDKLLNFIFKTDNYTNFNYVNQSDNVFKIILTTDQDLIANGVQSIDDEFLEWFVKNPNCEFVEIKTRYRHYYKTGEVMISLNGTPEFSSRNMQCIQIESVYKIIIPQKEPRQETIQQFIEKHGITEQQLIDGYKQGLDLIFENASKIPKQETLEEAAERISKTNSVYETAQDDFYHGFVDGAKWQAERMYSEEEVLQMYKDYEAYVIKTPITEVIEFSKWFEQFKKKD